MINECTLFYYLEPLCDVCQVTALLFFVFFVFFAGPLFRVLTVIGERDNCVGVFEECLEKVKNVRLFVIEY